MHDGLSDDVQTALREQGLHGRTLKSAKDIDAAAHIMEKHGDHTEKVGAMALRRASPVLEGLYRDKDMNYASVAAAAGLVLASHGFMKENDIPELGNLIKAETGSAELADTMLVQTELAGAASTPHLKAGYAHRYDEETGNFIGLKEAGRDLDVIGTLSPGNIAGAKTGAIKDMGETIDFILNSTPPSQVVKDQRQQQAAQKLEATRQAAIQSVTEPIRSQIKQQYPTADSAEVEKLVSQQVGQDQIDTAISQSREVKAAEAEFAQVQQNNATLSPLEDAQQRVGQTRNTIIANHEERIRTANPGMSDREVAAIRQQQIPDAQIEKEVKKQHANANDFRAIKAGTMGDAFKQQLLFSAASRFSQAPVDTKTEIMNIIAKHPDVMREFEIYEGRAAAGDPEVMAMIQASNTGMQSQQQQQMFQAQQVAQGTSLRPPGVNPGSPL